MSRALTFLAAELAVASAIAATALLSSGDSAGTGTSAALPSVTCSDRAEPSPHSFDPRRDVVRGPFALIGARGVGRRPASSFRPKHGLLGGTKFPVAVRAGHTADVRISSEDAADAALLAGRSTREVRRVEDGDAALRYRPCSPDTASVGGEGVVGPITGWAGALIVTGPRCVTLEITVSGARRRDVSLPLGRRCRASAFKPADGRYAGEYTSGNHGPGKPRLRVGPLRPGLHGVRLLKWSGKLRCPDNRIRQVGMEMTAARVGRTFSGFVTHLTPPGGKENFTGRFTATDALKGRVRVTRGNGAGRCDTGRIKFVAHRVGP